MPPRPRVGRKVLIASIGIAALNYGDVACGDTVGNLAPAPMDAGSENHAAAAEPLVEAPTGHDAVE
jgi:hypothetical protein